MNIEAHIITWLSSLSLGIEAYKDVPATRPKEFAVVRRIGGQRDNLAIDRPSVALQFWAANNARAAELAYQVDEFIEQLAHNNHISRVSRTALYSFSAADSGHARYQIELDLVCVT